MIEAELCNLCLWHYQSPTPPPLKDASYYEITDPNNQYTLGKQQVSSRDHPEASGPLICITFLPQRKAVFVPLFCSLKACFWLLNQNDICIQGAIYSCQHGCHLYSGVYVFQVFTEVLPFHLSETGTMEMWIGAHLPFFE